MNADRQEQRRITRLALEAAGDDAGFALAGSGAVREHGLIDRPTEDIDLFTVQQAQAEFGASLDRIIAALRVAGYIVERCRRQDTFAQLTATSGSGRSTDVDLGVDWRAHPPVRLEVGPVLSVDDAVGNRSAHCSREPRPAITSMWTRSGSPANTATTDCWCWPNELMPASTWSGSPSVLIR